MSYTCYIHRHYGPKKRGIFTRSLQKRQIISIPEWINDGVLPNKHIILYDDPRKIQWDTIYSQCRLINIVPFAQQIIYKHTFLDFIRKNIGSRFFRKYPYGFNIKTNKEYLKTQIDIYSDHQIYLPSFGTDIWIIKPYFASGGRSIEILNTDELLNLTNTKYNNYIAQKYIEKPLLVNGKKFDIRMHVLFTQECKLYIFNQMLIRQSSAKYDLKSKDRLSHLTNVYTQTLDHIENLKFSYHSDDFFRLYQQEYEKHPNYKDKNKITKEAIKIIFSIFDKIDMTFCKKKNIFFQLFGIDIFLDENFNVFIIEINNNPGMVYNDKELQLSKLQIMYNNLIDDVFKLTIDKLIKIKFKSNNFIFLKQY